MPPPPDPAAQRPLDGSKQDDVASATLQGLHNDVSQILKIIVQQQSDLVKLGATDSRSAAEIAGLRADVAELRETLRPARAGPRPLSVTVDSDKSPRAASPVAVVAAPSSAAAGAGVQLKAVGTLDIGVPRVRPARHACEKARAPTTSPAPAAPRGGDADSPSQRDGSPGGSSLLGGLARRVKRASQSSRFDSPAGGRRMSWGGSPLGCARRHSLDCGSPFGGMARRASDAGLPPGARGGSPLANNGRRGSDAGLSPSNFSPASRRRLSMSGMSAVDLAAAQGFEKGSYGDEKEKEQRLAEIVDDFMQGRGVHAEGSSFGGGPRTVGGAIVRLRKMARRALSDASSAASSETKHSRLRSLCHASARYLPVLHPTHPFLHAWDALTLLMLGYIAMGLPLVVGWHPAAWRSLAPVHVVIDCLFVLDALLCFRRGYRQDGMEVNDTYRVALRYMRVDMPFDVLAALPYLAIAHTLPTGGDAEAGTSSSDAAGGGGAGSSGAALGVALLMMLEQLRVVLRLLRARGGAAAAAEQAHRNPVVRRLLQILLLLLLMFHWTGAMYWTVAAAEHAELSASDMATVGGGGGAASADGAREEWRPGLRVLGETWTAQWAHAFLWGASLVTGFVLYDVRPSTRAEVVVTLIALCLGLAMNTVIISTTTSLLQAIDTRNAFGRQRLDKIGKYLEFKNVRHELRAKIVAFYAYKLTSSTVSLKDVDFTELPSDLATHLTLELHKTLLKKCFIFSALPSELLVPLLRKLQPMVAVPGDAVVREGHANDKLFFIHRGTVHVFKTVGPPLMATQQLLTTLEDNDFFGEASLLPEGGAALDFSSFKTAGKANATIVCFSYCEFLTLSFQHVAGLSHLMSDQVESLTAALKEGAERRQKSASERNSMHGMNTDRRRSRKLSTKLSFESAVTRAKRRFSFTKHGESDGTTRRRFSFTKSKDSSFNKSKDSSFTKSKRGKGGSSTTSVLQDELAASPLAA